MTTDKTIYIGRVGKIAKNAKEITVNLAVYFSEKINLNNEPIFVRMNESDQVLVPFFVHFYHFDKNKLRVALDDILHPEDLDLLKNKAVYIAGKFGHTIITGDTTEETLAGFTVIDQTAGKIGVITGFLSVKNNPLLTVDTGEKEILIPFNEAFIIAIDENSQTLSVDIPEGLLNL